MRRCRTRGTRAVADPLAHAPRVLAPASSVRSSSQVTISKPQPRGSSRSEARVQRPAHAGQQRALRVDQALLERALERRAVEVALAVVLLPGVGVGVEQHERRAGRARRRARAARRARSSGRRRARAASRRRASTRLELRRRSAPRCAPRCRASCAGRRGRRASARRTRRPPAAGSTAAAAARRRGSPSGPKRAPGRQHVAVSNGTPTTAASTPSGCGHVRQPRERADARVARRERGVRRAVARGHRGARLQCAGVQHRSASPATSSRPSSGSSTANRARALAAIDAAAGAGAQVVVLPELVSSGYVFRDADEARSLAEPADGPTLAGWAERAAARGLVIAGGFAELGADGAALQQRRAGRRERRARRLPQGAPVGPREARASRRATSRRRCSTRRTAGSG